MVLGERLLMESVDLALNLVRWSILGVYLLLLLPMRRLVVESEVLLRKRKLLLDREVRLRPGEWLVRVWRLRPNLLERPVRNWLPLVEDVLRGLGLKLRAKLRPGWRPRVKVGRRSVGLRKVLVRRSSTERVVVVERSEVRRRKPWGEVGRGPLLRWSSEGQLATLRERDGRARSGLFVLIIVLLFLRVLAAECDVNAVIAVEHFRFWFYNGPQCRARWRSRCNVFRLRILDVLRHFLFLLVVLNRR